MTTTADSSTTLSTAVEQTWAKLRAVREQIRDLRKVEEELAGALRSELGRGHFVPSDGPTISIAPTLRFDPVVAEQILPAHLLPQVQRTIVDPKLAKEKLTPELYLMCQVEKDKDTVRALT